jgi:hypothetical protein
MTTKLLTRKLIGFVLGLIGIVFAILFVARAGGLPKVFELFQNGQKELLLTSFLLVFLSRFVQSLAWFINLRRTNVKDVSMTRVFEVFCGAYAVALIAPLHSPVPGLIALMSGVLKVPVVNSLTCWVVTTYAALLATGVFAIGMLLLVPTHLRGGILPEPMVLVIAIVVLILLGITLRIFFHSALSVRILRKLLKTSGFQNFEQAQIVEQRISVPILILIMLINCYIPWALQISAAWLALIALGVSTLTFFDILILFAAVSLAGRVAPSLLSIGAGQVTWAIVLTELGIASSTAQVIGAVLPFMLTDGPTLLLGGVSTALLAKYQYTTTKLMDE